MQADNGGKPGEPVRLLALEEEARQRTRAEVALAAEARRTEELREVADFQRTMLVSMDPATIGASLRRTLLEQLSAEGDEAAIAVLQGLTATVCSRLAGVNGLVQEEVLAPSKDNVFQRLWAKVGRLGRK